MRKLVFLGLLLGILGLSVPVSLSFAGGKAEWQGKTKVKAYKKVYKKSVKKAKKGKKSKFAYRKPRYATKINQPQEGQLLKLEGMVKDLNAQ